MASVTVSPTAIMDKAIQAAKLIKAAASKDPEGGKEALKDDKKQGEGDAGSEDKASTGKGDAGLADKASVGQGAGGMGGGK